MNKPDEKAEPQILIDGVPTLCETTAFDDQAESDENPASSSSCGRYLLDRLLGSGGFGEVWKGVDPSLNRPVAIKRLRTDRPFGPETMTAFVEEGRKLALLKHPGIVSVFDAGMSDGQPFIVSELIAEGSLAVRLKQEKIEIPEACQIIRELAETLHYLHAQGIVHRDIKPQNILMENGKPKLADFGLAISEFEQLAERPGVVGTYSYMSPEQIRGDSHLVDGRSDIYSLGVVFYQMLAGRKPFLGDSREQLQDQILKRDPRPLRSIDDQIPPALEEICLKCLKKAASERYSTARDLAREIEKYERKTNEPKFPKRAAVWAAVLLIGVGASAGFAWYNRPEPTKVEAPGPEGVEGQAEPQVPDPVKNLLGDLQLDVATDYTVDPAGRHLSVVSSERSLVSLGTIGDDDFEWETSFSQPGWSGNIGVFFGYRPSGDGRHTQYHGLYVFKVQNDLYLRASRFDYRTEAPGGTHTTHEIPQRRITDIHKNGQNTIRVSFHKGKLTELQFNGEDLSNNLLPEINRVLEPQIADCRGQFGLLNIASSGRFMAPMINEEEVLFPAPK